MKTKLALGSLLFGGLAACGTVPDPHPDYAVSVSDIVNNIGCELRAAAKTSFIKSSPNGWLAGIDMSLQVIAETSATVAVDTKTTLKPQIIVVTTGYSNSGKADRKATFSFKFDLGNPERISCDENPSSLRGGRRLRGNLGIESWLANMDTTIGTTKIKPDKVGYVLEFTVAQGGSVGPALSLIPIWDSSLGAGFGIAGSRSDVQTMTIAYTENAPTPPPAKGAPKGRGRKQGPSPGDRAKNDAYLFNLIDRQDTK